MPLKSLQWWQKQVQGLPGQVYPSLLPTPTPLPHSPHSPPRYTNVITETTAAQYPRCTYRRCPSTGLLQCSVSCVNRSTSGMTEWTASADENYDVVESVSKKDLCVEARGGNYCPLKMFTATIKCCHQVQMYNLFSMLSTNEHAWSVKDGLLRRLQHC